MKKVKDVMNREFHVIPAKATVADAAKMMDELDVGMLPVVEEGRLLGTVTDRDITVRVVSRAKNPAKTAVSEAMTPNAVCLSEDEDVEQAAKLMERKKVRRLLVADKERRPSGIVSLGDLALGVKDDRLVHEVVSEVSRP